MSTYCELYESNGDREHAYDRHYVLDAHCTFERPLVEGEVVTVFGPWAVKSQYTVLAVDKSKAILVKVVCNA